MMFKIKNRIVDNINELKMLTIDTFNAECPNISGYISVTIDEHKFGFFHEHPIRPDEIGYEWINWWLKYFLRCAHDISRTKYTAFCMPESSHIWLEFEMADDIIVFNKAITKSSIIEKPLLNGQYIEDYIVEKFNGFSYVEPIGSSIAFHDFLREIINATKIFLDELELLCPYLMDSNMVKDMSRLLKMVEHGLKE